MLSDATRCAYNKIDLLPFQRVSLLVHIIFAAVNRQDIEFFFGVSKLHQQVRYLLCQLTCRRQHDCKDLSLAKVTLLPEVLDEGQAKSQSLS